MASEAKHTPGPWHVDRNGLSGYGDNGNTFNIRTQERRGGKHIAALPRAFRLLDEHSTGDADYIEEEANARLIAAAPELLEASAPFVPKNVALDNANIQDDQIVPLEVSVGELRKLSAAITKATA